MFPLRTIDSLSHPLPSLYPRARFNHQMSAMANSGALYRAALPGILNQQGAKLVDEEQQ